MLVIIWHLLTNPDLPFHDLGPDHYDRRGKNVEAQKRHHIAQLQALGYTVTLTPAA